MFNHPLQRAARVVAFLSASVAAFGAAPVKPDHFLAAKPSNMIWGYFSAETPPVLTVKSGASVEIDTMDLTGITPEDPEQFFKDHKLPLNLPAIQDLIAVKRGVKPTGIRGHMMTGPIYVEGAQPGDTLEVRILDVKTRVPYAMNMMRPGGGGIPDLVPRPYAKYIPIDLEHQVALFADRVKVPLRPFQGVLAVAPTPERGKLPSGPPYADIGGNFDNKDLCKGTTVYFPVQVPGALFHIGDPHAVQGDGEVDGGAAETSNTVIVQLIVRKDLHITAVRAENATHYMVFGVDVELSLAMHKAIANSVEFLKETQGLDFFNALSLCSVGVDFRVTEVVDVAKGIHSMIPKSYFEPLPGAAPYWYRPEVTYATAR
jgi:acetamidase/formamidase